MTDDELLDALGAEWANHQRFIADSAVPLRDQSTPPAPAAAWDALYDEAIRRNMSAADVELEAQHRTPTRRAGEVGREPGGTSR